MSRQVAAEKGTSLIISLLSEAAKSNRRGLPAFPQAISDVSSLFLLRQHDSKRTLIISDVPVFPFFPFFADDYSSPWGHQYDGVFGSIVIGLPALLAYVVSRMTYTRMRWRTIDDPDGRYCRHCGYDLTGNVSGRCPECGEPVEAAGP